ncbi:MAG: cation transporting ATPase C-terminal domain-containing protein [Deltaproteobacteria bacterium]
MTEISLILFLTYTPFMQNIFGLAPLGWREWGFLLVFPVIVLLMEEGRKWVVRTLS